MIRSATPRTIPDGFVPGSAVTRYATLTPTSYNAERRTVEAVLSTGAQVRRWGIVEELAIGPDAVDLGRVALGQVRVLDHHNAYSRDAILGVLVDARFENGMLVGTLRFGDTDEAREAEGQVARGELTGISVGYQVRTWTLRAVEDNTEIWRADRWELLEVSLVSVPADPRAAVRSAANSDLHRAPAHNQEDDMRRSLNAPAGAAPANPDPADRQDATQAAAPAQATRQETPATIATPPSANQDAAAAVAAERRRIAAIQEIGERAGMPADAIRAAVTDGSLVETFRTRAFDHMAASAQRTATSAVTIARDEADARRNGMRDAIVARLARAAARSGERIEVPEHARRFAEMGFAEMAAECIGHRGNLRTAAQVLQVMERAFHTTSDFPGIFVDAMNVRLLARYQAATPAYRRFAALYTATDFKPTHVVRAGDFPTLQPVSEAGEIKSGTFSESKEIFRVYPYGVKFNITRQMIVNDNLGAIDQMLGSAGERVTDWENAKAFEKLVEGSGQGPTLATDSKRVFHADHGNYTSTGTAIAIASLGVGRAALMKQTSLDGIKLNLAPATIMTGPDRLTEAEQLTTMITPATVGTAVPDWVRRLTPVGDANVTGNAWYLIADPAVAAAFVYGYLEGFQGPRLSTEEQFGVQGVAVKLEHDFGVEAIDYRPIYKNNGAAPA